MIVQRWERSLETSVILLLSACLTAYPEVRPGLSLVFARASILRSASQRGLEFPLPRLRSRRCTISGLAGPLPRQAPWSMLRSALTCLPRQSAYLATAPAVGTSRAMAQMKPASSRATAVMATVLSFPLRTSAR